MNDTFKLIGLYVSAFAIAAIASLINGAFILWLWNALLPSIFGITTITYWQGVGISLLSLCIFGRATSSSKNN